MSEQKPSHEVEGIVRSAPKQDCVEAQIWGRVPKHVCSIEGPKNTVASIILKRKKFGTTKTLPTAGPQAKLRTRGRRALVMEVDQEPNRQHDRALEFLCGDGRPFQTDNHLCSTTYTNQAFMVEWPNGSQSAVKGT